jgi:CelD/BcsL family acetyltransferase involved in cellulose biosynthesis
VTESTSTIAAFSLRTLPVEWLNPLTDSRWAEFVGRHSAACVFHSVGWLESLKHTYGYEPTAVAVAGADKRLLSAIVFCRVSSTLTGRRLVSLPFSDHCDPLVESNEEFEGLIATAGEAQRRGNERYIEWRPSGATCDSTLPTPAPYRLHSLDLSAGEAAVFRGFHRNHVVRKIRRSERERLIYAEGASAQLLDAFYGLLLRTRRRHGMPPQPKRWFRNILEHLPDIAKVRVAYADRRPIAAILTLEGPHTMIFKYGASDARFHPLGGVQMLLWRAIQEAVGRGCGAFDFGRSDIENAGLIAFKDHWGATSKPLTYCYYPPRAAGRAPHRVGRLLARGFARFAPERLLVAGGSLVYPHLG